jgi:methionine-rich copper-binding protein CopC
MMRLPCLLTIAILGLAPHAFAHAFLEHAQPPVGSETATPPRQIVLTFTEGVEPLFSTIELHDPHGATLTIGTPHTAPGNNRELVVDVPALGSGRYRVVWHVTSVDTHKTEGSYQFTITP